MRFRLSQNFSPRGDQAQAIDKLTRSLVAGNRHQTLLGVTGSGKTFTVANIIQEIDRPTLVMSHNKTLAAQLYSEFKQFFPDNAVEYFVSYFDYYQPEAYIPRTDTYIEKDSAINDEIERLRLSTMSSLLSRRDVLVVASVSCIYGLADPEDFEQMLLTLKQGQAMSREELLGRLVDMLYERNDVAFERGKFRVRGDVVEVFPANKDEQAVRIEFFGDEIERMTQIDPLTGHMHDRLVVMTIFPAKQFVTPLDKLQRALGTIREELEVRVREFESQGKLIEAQRIRMRTEFDLEMMQEMGFCPGIENYSRHLSGREPGTRPYTLLDFLPRDHLLVIDESHASVPQIGGMFEGDRSRKSVLVEHGFRLPSALDNRPLKFDEFMSLANQLLYVSATPGVFELTNSYVGNKDYISVRAAEAPGSSPGVNGAGRKESGGTRYSLRKAKSDQSRRTKPLLAKASCAGDPFDPHAPGAPLVVEQIIRPTGLLDPKITVLPLAQQIDETITLCRERIARGERVLVTTLTKRTAEDLTMYLKDVGLKVQYLHSDVQTIERVEILRALRAGEYDVLVGINLLREGLDLPEVSLVCILDADKEGYLRSRTSLIQTAGRAARHADGHVVLFADTVTRSMADMIAISESRRARQLAYNEEHGITPQSVKRAVQESLHTILKAREIEESVVRDAGGDFNLVETLRELEAEMQEAAAALEYERAALLRDQIRELKSGMTNSTSARPAPRKKISYKTSARKKRR